MGTELDLLIVGNCLLRKEQQDNALIEDYISKYELD
jgi:carbamoyltransferase